MLAGTAELYCNFPMISAENGHHINSRRYRLEVPTSYMMVLLLFNQLAAHQSLSFEDIQKDTMLPFPEVQKILNCLSSSPNANILLKNPATQTPQLGDRFFFNETFTGEVTFIKIPAFRVLEDIDCLKEVQKPKSKRNEVEASFVEACIVRIMK
jgi:cullin 3